MREDERDVARALLRVRRQDGRPATADQTGAAVRYLDDLAQFSDWRKDPGESVADWLIRIGCIEITTETITP